jgi:hypothetical protein
MIDDASLRAATTELLRALIRIDTSNPPGRETPAALEIGRYLEAHGIEYELVARHPDRANLVARIRGAGDGPSLCFLGTPTLFPRRMRIAGRMRHSQAIWTTKASSGDEARPT